jgi:hypothetical protein
MLKDGMRDQKGAALTLVFVLLVVGGLILTPLLGLMSTGLICGQIYERKTAELYAADAGVEDAIWKIMNGEESELPMECANAAWNYSYPGEGSPPFRVNGKDIEVSIEYQGDRVFRITSTAISTDTDSSTTVLSNVEGDYTYAYADTEHTIADGGEHGNIEGNVTVYALGNFNVTGNIENGALVYVEGDLVVDGTIEGGEIGGAEVYVKGNLILTGDAKLGNGEDPVVICVGGNLTAPGNVETGAQVFVQENLTIGGIIETGAEVCVQRDATVMGVEWKEEESPPTIVCVGGHLAVNIDASGENGNIEGGYIYGDDVSVQGISNPTGGIYYSFEACSVCYPDCEECDCCECQWPAATLYWAGFEVATYNINP